MIAALLGLWRYGLLAALIAAAGVWHLADKSRAVDDAVEIVRAEYITAALAASESARSKEKALNLSIERVRNDFTAQKTRNVAAAAVSAGRLRDLQTALADASAASANPTAATGIDGPFAIVASECSRELVALDEYAEKLASTAKALQDYAHGLRLKD
jgi:uncharacterized protein YbaP (TraB family)